MLKIIRTMNQLKFSELMNVYAESNMLNGKELYPNLTEQSQILEAEQYFYQYLNDIFFRQKDSFYAIWECDGHYRSALRIEPYEDGLLLSGLETAPASRGQGYAVKLILAVLEYLQETCHFDTYSHISKKNQQSLLVHEKCGFQIILDHAVYSDGSVMHNHYTLIHKHQKSET